jgi:hypothetical protein
VLRLRRAAPRVTPPAMSTVLPAHSSIAAFAIAIIAGASNTVRVARVVQRRTATLR